MRIAPGGPRVSKNTKKRMNTDWLSSSFASKARQWTNPVAGKRRDWRTGHKRNVEKRRVIAAERQLRFLYWWLGRQRCRLKEKRIINWELSSNIEQLRPIRSDKRSKCQGRGRKEEEIMTQPSQKQGRCRRHNTKEEKGLKRRPRDELKVLKPIKLGKGDQ